MGVDWTRSEIVPHSMRLARIGKPFLVYEGVLTGGIGAAENRFSNEERRRGIFRFAKNDTVKAECRWRPDKVLTDSMVGSGRRLGDKRNLGISKRLYWRDILAGIAGAARR